MRKLLESKIENSPTAKRYLQLFRELAFFVRQCLGKKKILIISEKSITSVPVSSRFQGLVTVSVLAFMLWVSYSTGKYFAYENIISEKDHEIWSTNVTNESLQYQVTDLHQNLKELNKYFENIREYDQLSQKKIFDGDPAEEGSLKTASRPLNESLEEDASAGAQNILFNIRTKVLERISSLESIIEMTGLRLEEVASRNENLHRALENTREDNSNQGGPYIPLESDDLFNKSDFENSVHYLLQLEQTIHSLPLAVPLTRYWVSSGFGTRKDPIHNHMAIHAGIDLIGPSEAKIHSSAPGLVKRAQRYGAYGRFIEIDHGSGITTRYGHLGKILVKEGETVKRGQVIGLQGSSGRSTGPHLHYEVRNNNKPFDPAKFLKAGKYVF